MELSEKVYNKLNSLFEKSKKKSIYELEIRFSSQKINYQIYKNIFQKLTFSKLNNGKELKYSMINDLDIILSSNNTKSRMTISGSENIKKYWLNQDLNEDEYSYIEKEKIDTYDDHMYDLRLSLNEELPKEKIIKKNMEFLKSTNKPKYYRFKNRYRIHAEDDSFFIDLTNVKSGYGPSFRESNTLESVSKYEIEIEVNNEVKKDTIDDLLSYIYLILTEIEGNSIILSNQVKDKVIEDYYELVQVKYNQNKYSKNDKNKFIAASPKTIHKENLINSTNIKNLYNHYAVTLKADGERYLLFIDNEGKQYLMNNQFHVLSNGQINSSYKNSLIEGELIETDTEKIFYAYDMLFSKGNDIRKRWLKALKRDPEEKHLGRIDFLNQFLEDKNHQELENYKESKNIIQTKKKPYEYSLRNDGSDIFDKIKSIWNTRKSFPFEVDGMILCPIMEHYPLRGGTWDSLFKWKPSNLNTIDFLVKFLKDENGTIISSPYIQNEKRADKIKEQSLKMYYTLELYVGTSENVFNKNQKRMVTKIKPALFNPYQHNTIELDDNNSTKVFINGNEKIYCTDPLTNEEEELMDNTIVEFGYDEEAENGFHWKPYRFRKDKTNLYKSGENVFGNFDRVANDIFRSIKNPVTEEMITTGQVDISELNLKENKSYFSHLTDGNTNNKFRERLPYQNFHNFYIKYQLFYFTSPKYLNQYTSGMHGRMLDLCSGKGVDITKIKLMDYAEVVGLEVDGESVKYAQNFYKTVSRPKPKAYYVRSDTSKLIFPNQACGISESDKIYVKKFIPEKYYFDTVNLMFCVHYFFQNEITLRTIIQNISDNLKIGGHVIGTTFDGEVIYNQLKDKKEILGHKKGGELMWRIEKKYKSKMAFGEKRPNLGKEIDVFVKSIGVVHTEYLVNFKYFDKIMSDYGFEKVIQKPFQDFYDELMDGKNIMNLSPEELKRNKEKVEAMSEDEKRFSFLSTAFIYKKIEHAPDKLYIQLSQLMEKEDKVKDKNVFVMDKETAEIVQDAELDEEK